MLVVEKLQNVFYLCAEVQDRVLNTLEGLVEIFLEEALGKPCREIDRVVPGAIKGRLQPLMLC